MTTLLFVADPLDSFKTHKDTSFAMMREAARRGHQLFACEPDGLHWQRGGHVSARVREVQLTGRSGYGVHDWYTAGDEHVAPLARFGAVLMRKDPPFDSEFFYATHLLQRAEAEGARVFNSRRPCGTTPKSWPSWSFRNSSAPPWSRAGPMKCAPSMPSTATSSSSPSTAWGAWAFSG